MIKKPKKIIKNISELSNREIAQFIIKEDIKILKELAKH